MTSLRHHLSAFIESIGNLPEIYALAVVVGPEGRSVTFAAADEPTMEAKLDAAYPDVRPPWEEQFWGTRWNPGDFPHMQSVECSADLDSALEALEALGLVEAQDQTSQTLETTDEFVAFVARFDQSEDERKAWMRRTISPAAFERLFPELVAFERFLDNASAMAPGEQATFWAAAMEELTLKSATPRTAQLTELGRTQYDAVDALVAIGEPAVVPLMEIIERYAHHPPFNPPDSVAFQIHGAFSPQSRLTTDAMFALGEIGEVGDQTVERLRLVLKDLVEAYPATGTAGVAAAVAARVVHALRPAQFPPADVDPQNNRLRNSGDY